MMNLKCNETGNLKQNKNMTQNTKHYKYRIKLMSIDDDIQDWQIMKYTN